MNGKSSPRRIEGYEKFQETMGDAQSKKTNHNDEEKDWSDDRTAARQEGLNFPLSTSVSQKSNILFRYSTAHFLSSSSSV